MFRQMRRIGQLVDNKTSIELLKSAKRGILAVLGDDEYPYTVPMNFVYSDGHIYFHGATDGHKIDAIKRHDKVSFCVISDGEQEPDKWWFHYTSVVAFGRMSIITDEEQKLATLRMLGAKYFPTQALLDEEMTKHASSAMCLNLTIEHLTGKHIREK